MAKLSRRIIVEQLVEGRYPAGQKPISWDERREGVEVVKTNTGEQIRLASSGGQSSPAKGWELLLTAVDPSSNAAKWTLYSLGPRK